jgi:hypothetical protein
MRPVKEKRGLRWHLQHPGEMAVTGAILVPVLTFFWPMVVVGGLLPALEPRLSADMLGKLRRNPDLLDDELHRIEDQLRTINTHSESG